MIVEDFRQRMEGRSRQYVVDVLLPSFLEMVAERDLVLEKIRDWLYVQTKNHGRLVKGTETWSDFPFSADEMREMLTRRGE